LNLAVGFPVSVGTDAPPPILCRSHVLSGSSGPAVTASRRIYDLAVDSDSSGDDGDGGDGLAIRVVLACPDCGVHWYVGAGPARCTDPGHEHQRFEVHRHRAVVVLPDGTEVTAVSFDPLDPYGRDAPADYGLYLDDAWQPPWAHEHLDWPDFGVPDDAAPVVAALRSLRDRARAGDRVELGCLGGHGRTGTALACLAVLAGHPPAGAVAWVRTNYCPEAVETPDQESFVATLDP
jgi:hypothetical protein